MTADWVKLNVDELAQLQPQAGSLQQAMQAFIERYRLQGLLVTLGEQGAVCLLANGEEYEVKPESNIAVVDCVGAGDAFSAVMLLGLARSWPLPTTMQRAQTFASALVGQRGATVRDRAFYQRFVEAWLD
jgi:fructokinase